MFLSTYILVNIIDYAFTLSVSLSDCRGNVATDNISNTNESLTDPSPPPARKWKKGDKLNTSAPFQNAEGWKSFFFPLLQTLSYLVFANLTVYCFMPPSSPLFFSSASLFFLFLYSPNKGRKDK